MEGPTVPSNRRDHATATALRGPSIARPEKRQPRRHAKDIDRKGRFDCLQGAVAVAQAQDTGETGLGNRGVEKENTTGTMPVQFGDDRAQGPIREDEPTLPPGDHCRKIDLPCLDRAAGIQPRSVAGCLSGSQPHCLATGVSLGAPNRQSAELYQSLGDRNLDTLGDGPNIE